MSKKRFERHGQRLWTKEPKNAKGVCFLLLLLLIDIGPWMEWIVHWFVSLWLSQSVFLFVCQLLLIACIALQGSASHNQWVKCIWKQTNQEYESRWPLCFKNCVCVFSFLGHLLFIFAARARHEVEGCEAEGHAAMLSCSCCKWPRCSGSVVSFACAQQHDDDTWQWYKECEEEEEEPQYEEGQTFKECCPADTSWWCARCSPTWSTADFIVRTFGFCVRCCCAFTSWSWQKQFTCSRGHRFSFRAVCGAACSRWSSCASWPLCESTGFQVGRLLALFLGAKVPCEEIMLMLCSTPQNSYKLLCGCNHCLW